MYDEYDGDDYGEYDQKHLVWGAGGDDTSALADDYENYSDLADPRALYTNCLLPTLETAGLQLGETLALCALYRAVVSIPVVRSSGLYRNYANVLFGLAILYRYFEHLLVYVCVYSVSLLVLVLVLQRFRYVFHTLLVVSIVTITACEYALTGFIQVRSVFMLMSIKLLSVVVDMRSRLPRSLDLLGYLFSPGTVLFGPWASYKQYIDSMEKPAPVSVTRIAKHALLTLFYLSCTCAVMVFPTGPWRLGFVYRDALSFRVSHYFISAMSAVTFLVAGFSPDASLPVCSPLHVELPHSLKLATAHWNRPLSQFLNTYIFRELRLANVFLNLLVTYVVSCGLHGFNPFISQILLCLSVYAYVEYKLRAQLARALDACVRSTLCPAHCTAHAHNVWSMRSVLVNALFLLLNVYHLAYLGCILNSEELYRDPDAGLEFPPQRWANLGYVSPYIMFAMYIVYIVL